MTIAELTAETAVYLQRNQGTSEFDMSINDISREKINALKNHYGTAYLGRINRYEEDKGKPYLVEYTGQQVYNFEYGFVIPSYDEELIDLIRKRELSPYKGTQKDKIMIDAIFQRIADLKGLHLLWS